MRTTETEIIEVEAEVEEVRCDVEGCGKTARPARSGLPDRLSASFARAVPGLDGWIEVKISASPGSGETDEDDCAYLHVCPDHVDGAWETTDLLQDNLTSVLQGYLARKGVGLEDRDTHPE